jgi:hypothetical protein
MDLEELREKAISSLTAAATTIAKASITPTMESNGWTVTERERLAHYFLELVEGIDLVESGTNMSKWFDFVLTDLTNEDEIMRTAYDTSRIYNAYVHRRS